MQTGPEARAHGAHRKKQVQQSARPIKHRPWSQDGRRPSAELEGLPLHSTGPGASRCRAPQTPMTQLALVWQKALFLSEALRTTPGYTHSITTWHQND